MANAALQDFWRIIEDEGEKDENRKMAGDGGCRDFALWTDRWRKFAGRGNEDGGEWSCR